MVDITWLDLFQSIGLKSYINKNHFVSNAAACKAWQQKRKLNFTEFIL